MRYFIAFLFTASMACNQASTEKAIPYTDHLPGLASPIQLGYDQTVINVSDYLPNSDSVLVIYGNDTLTPNHQNEITISLNQPFALGVISFLSTNVQYDIPTFKSQKLRYSFQYTSTNEPNSIAIAGNFNGWNPSSTPLTKSDLSWTTELILNPGIYQYQIVEDGQWMLDHNHENKLENGQGGFNSTFKVGNPYAQRPVLQSVISEDSISVYADTESNIYVWFEDFLVSQYKAQSNEKINISLPSSSKSLNYSTVRIWATTADLISDELTIPLKNGSPIMQSSELPRSDMHASIMYFLLIDRFADGDTLNNWPVLDPAIHPKANHLGGDFSGLLQQLSAGYFDSLGVNTIWVSPITLNADGAWGLWTKGVTSKFSGYHGYWPISNTQIDPHFGNDSTFKLLIDEVHRKNKNIIVDYVANHVHQDHPLYKQHPDWATDLYLPDGTMNTEKWDEYRLTTWFDTFLPTLDLEKVEVTEAMTDSAMFWLTNYDIDGFRHDATKHIPEIFWRTLTKKIKVHQSHDNTGKAIFQIGETYGNPELIRSYISSGMLDAQFDFNLYDAAIDAFANPDKDFDNLARVLDEGIRNYGAHHLMGNITGNQDRARFISYADGSIQFSEDAKLAGWTRNIQNQEGKGYAELESLFALVMTIPGIPCIYYGDEIGLPGGNDPDNRRMMQFDGLNNEQVQLRKAIAELTKIRSSRMSLIYGGTRIERKDQLLVIERSYGTEKTLMVFSNAKGGQIQLDRVPVVLRTTGCEIQQNTVSFRGKGYAILTFQNS